MRYEILLFFLLRGTKESLIEVANVLFLLICTVTLKLGIKDSVSICQEQLLATSFQSNIILLLSSCLISTSLAIDSSKGTAVIT